MSAPRTARRTMFLRTPAVLATAVIAALVLAACTGGGEEATPEGSQGFPDDGCTHITVATSSEKVNMLDELATSFKDSPEHESLGTCTTVRPTNVSSGTVADTLVAGIYRLDRPRRRGRLTEPRRKTRIVHPHPCRLRDAGADGEGSRLAGKAHQHHRARGPVPGS